VKGRWWKTFGYVVAFAVLAVLCTVILGAVFKLLPDSRVTEIVGNSAMSVVSSFFNVVSAIFFIRFEATRMEEVTAPVQGA
jgi:hypothetical protein